MMTTTSCHCGTSFVRRGPRRFQEPDFSSGVYLTDRSTVGFRRLTMLSISASKRGQVLGDLETKVYRHCKLGCRLES